MIVLPITLATLLLVTVCRFGWRGVQNLSALRIRSGWLLVLVYPLQLISILTQHTQLALLLVNGIIVLSVCWANRHHRGLIIVLVGVSLNLAVMGANGGSMPVSPNTILEKNGVTVPGQTILPFTRNRVLSDEQALLAILGDRILLPGPLAGIAAWSIGDILLIFGIARLLWTTMKGTSHDSYTPGTGKPAVTANLKPRYL